jgi:hypothetical protein
MVGERGSAPPGPRKTFPAGRVFRPVTRVRRKQRTRYQPDAGKEGEW